GRARRAVLLASGKRALAVEIPARKEGVSAFCCENHQETVNFNRSVE
ncbi:multidrug resistance pump, partial [Salmonella enterica subsp. enterica serovar Rubislaw str. A4-653]